MQKDTPQIAVCIHPRYIEFGPTQPGGPREDKTLLTLPYCFVYRINYDSDIAILFLFTELITILTLPYCFCLNKNRNQNDSVKMIS